jgi:DNA-binding winged helix-turn-helix (wHTH) protein
MSDLERGFALEALRVEPRSGLVTGPGGREKLDPKVMDVLVLMADYAGQVVLRDDLLDRLWPHVVVTDDALTRCIYVLRRQFRLAGGDDRYRMLIETVPKRGYRLNAEVRPAAAPQAARAAVAAGRHRSLWIAIGSAAALAVIAAGLYL